MWAQRLIAPGRFERIELPELSEQDVPEGHVLLRTLIGGICGSDLPVFRGGLFPAREGPGLIGRVPGLPMHEVVGEVVATRHPAHSAGDIVVGWASGFDAIAEYIVSDGSMLIAVDPALDPVAAITIQPLACVLFAVEQISNIAGARAAVLGQGPIGLLFSHVLAGKGAQVTGVDRVYRSGEAAAAFGVSETVTASAERWVAQLTDAGRPNLIVEAIGHQVGTLRLCFEAAAFGGQVFYFGVPDDQFYPMEMKMFFRKNLTLRAGWTMDRRRVLHEAAAYLAAHDDLRDAYVSHVFKADEVQRAFEAAEVPKPGQFKIALDMTA